MSADPRNELVFLPLGGSNEIGMNLNAYGFGPAERTASGSWSMSGSPSAILSTPGVDVIVPDPTYLEGETILGIVLTHAHEDHIGALGWLWPRLKAPLYATPFTAFLIREKLRERGILDEVELIEVPLGGTIDLGPFEVTMVTMTHSIAEPNGLAIKTPLGTVLHTGDWKIDDDPVIGERHRCPPPSAASATRACWPWSAIPPMSSSTARRGRRPRSVALTKLIRSG
jgi:ribonuclease J